MARILLAEDNEMNREMLSRALIRAGYAVVTAMNGLEVVAMARTEQPDLIVMDMSLPELDGWEATRSIRADADAGSTPVIALTAHALPEDRQKALDAGCDDYDTKPVDIPGFLAKIRALLEPAAP